MWDFVIVLWSKQVQSSEGDDCIGGIQIPFDVSWAFDVFSSTSFMSLFRVTTGSYGVRAWQLIQFGFVSPQQACRHDDIQICSARIFTSELDVCIDGHEPIECLSGIHSTTSIQFYWCLERIWTWWPVLGRIRQLDGFCIPIGSSNFDYLIDRRGNHLAFPHLPISRF